MIRSALVLALAFLSACGGWRCEEVAGPGAGCGSGLYECTDGSSCEYLADDAFYPFPCTVDAAREDAFTDALEYCAES